MRASEPTLDSTGPAPADLRTAERTRLVDAALSVVRAKGIARLTVADVLEAANLGTRAFYRHFKSKDHLIISVFVDAGQVEAARLQARMEGYADPVDGVVAWIEGRLALAFDAAIESDLKHVSREAQALYTVEPRLMAGAYQAMLSPLVDELRRGAKGKCFRDVDAVADARAIQSVVWSYIEAQWTTPDIDRADHAAVSTHIITFCLRGIGTSSRRIAAALERAR